MKYLVLGSSGQIGKPLCDYLIQRGHEVQTFDIVQSANQDLREENSILGILMDGMFDCVIFLAFDVGGSVYLNKYQDSFDFIHNNTKLMSNTFETLKTFKIPFIFASTQMANMSHSSYGVLKTIGEYYTKSIGGLIVKLWNVYGPENDFEKSHVITDFIRKGMDVGKIDMLTDGKEYRQFLHATDCSRCIEILSQKYHDIPRDKELHVSSFEWSSVKEIAKIVSTELGGIEINPSDLVDTVQLDKRNEPNEHILEYWKPKITLSDGIRDMIDYYREKY